MYPVERLKKCFNTQMAHLSTAASKASTFETVIVGQRKASSKDDFFIFLYLPSYIPVNREVVRKERKILQFRTHT